MSPIRPQPCAAVETGTSCGACRLWFAGRGLRAQARVKTARLRSRPTWGPGFAATAVRQAPLAGETHCCEQGRRGRFQVYRSVSPRSERSYCLSAPWVSANEGLFLRPSKDGAVLLPLRACAPPDGGGSVCPSDPRLPRVLPCQPHDLRGDCPVSLAFQTHRSTPEPEAAQRGWACNLFQARSVTLAGKEDA